MNYSFFLMCLPVHIISFFYDCVNGGEGWEGMGERGGVHLFRICVDYCNRPREGLSDRFCIRSMHPVSLVCLVIVQSGVSWTKRGNADKEGYQRQSGILQTKQGITDKADKPRTKRGTVDKAG